MQRAARAAAVARRSTLFFYYKNNANNGEYYGTRNQYFIQPSEHSFSEQQAYLIDHKSHHPCQYHRVDHRERRPFPRELAADSGYRCHAGEVQQGKHEESIRANRRKSRSREVVAEEDGKRRSYRFLGGQTRQETNRHLPVEAQRTHHRFYPLTDNRDPRRLQMVEVLGGEKLERPDHHRGKQHDR